jgi:DNA-binding transcriptional regulator YbjK
LLIAHWSQVEDNKLAILHAGTGKSDVFQSACGQVSISPRNRCAAVFASITCSSVADVELDS